MLCLWDCTLLSGVRASRVGCHVGPAQTTEPPGQKPLVVNGVVVGPFEEEEEGTGIASDVIKVQGEDPATPGPLTFFF